MIEPLIQDGWIAQWRGTSPVSKLIEYGTGGVHSHSSMLGRSRFGAVDLLEVVEWYGGRSRPLRDHVERYPGMLDLFSIDEVHFPEFDGAGAVEVMRSLTGRDYGWPGVIRLGMRHVPLLWHLWPLEMDDEFDTHPPSCAPFCSHAVAFSSRVGGRVDAVPRKPDHLVTPNDLTRSLLYLYEGTLVP